MKRVTFIASVAIALVISFEPAFAEPVTFTAKLSSDPQGEQNASSGTGSATVVIDAAAHTLQVSITFAGLQNPSIAAHIHCLCTEPASTQTTNAATIVPTFPGFPLGVTSGTYSDTFDTLKADTYSPRFLKASGGTAATAEAALFSGMLAGQTYLNVHSVGTDRFGEIRGFLQRAK
jgi:hypothetical protein